MERPTEESRWLAVLKRVAERLLRSSLVDLGAGVIGLCCFSLTVYYRWPRSTYRTEGGATQKEFVDFLTSCNFTITPGNIKSVFKTQAIRGFSAH